MKKVFLGLLSLAIVFGTVPTLSAKGFKDVDMLADGGTYYFNFHNGNTDDVYGKLINQDYKYGDNYSGYGNIVLMEDNGKWAQICENSEYLSPNNDATYCRDGWHNKNEDFRTEGSYDYAVIGEGTISTAASIWSRLQ